MKKKKILLVYIMFLILCLLIIVIQSKKNTKLYKEELYGTTTDETVKLKDDTVISADFLLTDSDLRGISVKFQTKEQFENEQMKAQLFDLNADKLLAEDTVMLKYERVQNKDGGSFIYFKLPYENTKNKKVRLNIELVGNTDVYPELVVSKNKLKSSSLRVNNRNSNMNLVFKTQYFSGEKSKALTAVANGIFLILCGTLLFFFMYQDKREEQEFHNHTDFSRRIDAWKNKCWRKICNIHLFLGLVAVLSFICFYIVYVYKCGLSNAVAEKEHIFLKDMYVVFAIFALTTAVMIFIVCIWKKLPIEKVYFLSAISLGILMSLVISIDTVPDEPSHMDTAYALSNEILRIPESKKPGYIYKRVEDINSDAEERQSLSVKNYEWMYSRLYLLAKDKTLVECSARSNLANGGKVYYIPQALGISVGRLFSLGFLPTMMLGRLFSLLCYVMLTYFSLKKIPVGKVSLFLVGILPISLQQAASMSYDGMINAVALLYIAYNIHMFYNEEQVTIIDITVIALTGSLLATVKGGTYIPLCFLPLMLLWTRNRLQKKEKYCAISLVILFVFMFIKDRLLSIVSRLFVQQGEAIGGSGNQEIYTFGYLIRNPMRLLGLFTNTFHKQGDQQLRNLLGGNLAWRDININWYIIIFILLLLLLSCIRQEKERYITRTDKLYMGFLALSSFGLIELSMLLVWTPVTLNFITGVQGRYFIPFLLLILLCLRNSFFTIRKNIERQIIFLFCITDITVVLHVILVAVEK